MWFTAATRGEKRKKRRLGVAPKSEGKNQPKGKEPKEMKSEIRLGSKCREDDSIYTSLTNGPRPRPIYQINSLVKYTSTGAKYRLTKSIQESRSFVTHRHFDFIFLAPIVRAQPFNKRDHISQMLWWEIYLYDQIFLKGNVYNHICDHIFGGHTLAFCKSHLFSYGIHLLPDF